MKKISVILAILFLAFTVQAQTVEKSKRDTKKKNESAQVSKSGSKASKTKEVKTAPASKSNRSKAGTSSSKATSGRKSNNSSGKSATRSTETKTTRTSTTVTRQSNTRNTGSTQVKREDENRLGSSRTVSTPTSGTQRNVRGNQSTRVNSSYTPRTSPKDAEARRTYTIRHENRVMRPAPSIHYNYEPIEYRRVHNPYNRPVLSDIYWDSRMYRNYRLWYPDFNLWYYPYGYRIQMVSAYDAYNYIGEVARIYGVVSEVWYSPENRSYYLYVGGPYPYQDFTIVVEAQYARRFSHDPVRFFTNRQLTVTGLVSVFDGKPEMLIRRRSQIHLY